VRIFRITLLIMILAGSIFAWLNVQRQEYPLALAELGAVLVGLLDPTATQTLFGWVLGFPLLTHFLLGARLGLINAAVFMSLAAALYLQREELTVSIGVAQYGPDGEDFKTLFQQADQRLFKGKQLGRNHVEAGPQWSGNTVPSPSPD